MISSAYLSNGISGSVSSSRDQGMMRKRFARIGLTTPPCGVPFSGLMRVPSSSCTGALNHLPDVEEHPWFVDMHLNRPHKQLVVDAIEKAF